MTREGRVAKPAARPAHIDFVTLLPIFGLDDIEVLLLKHELHEPARRSVVLDQEDRKRRVTHLGTKMTFTLDKVKLSRFSC